MDMVIPSTPKRTSPTSICDTLFTVIFPVEILCPVILIGVGRAESAKNRKYFAFAEDACKKEYGVHRDVFIVVSVLLSAAWLAYSSPRMPHAEKMCQNFC